MKLVPSDPKIKGIKKLQRQSVLRQMELLILIVVVDILLRYGILFFGLHHFLSFNPGFATEILLIGLFIIFSSRIMDRSNRIIRYIEELENLPVLGTKKGTYMMKVLLRRLTDERYRGALHLKDLNSVRNETFQEIDLSVSLYNSSIEEIDIIDSKFGNDERFEMHNVIIAKSKLANTVFNGGEFYLVSFQDTLFDNCLFLDNSFTSLQFDHVKMWNVHFEKCLFRNPVRLNLGKQGVESMDLMVTSGFICSRLQDCTFEDVRFEGVDFTGAGIINCRFSNVTGLKASDFHHAKTLYRSILPEDIDQSLRETHPGLFEKPVR